MIGGELDMATAPELARVLGTISSSGGDIVLHLSFLSFVDESGLVVLSSTAERLSGSLVLDSPPPVLVRLLQLLRMTMPKNVVLRIPDRESATAETPDFGMP